MFGEAQLEEGLDHQSWWFHSSVQALRAGGAGVNPSKGQPVWLCWDLEPAADVLLGSGCFPLESGNHH